MCVVLNQTKNGVLGRVLAIDEVDRVLEHLVVDRLHPLLRQRPGVLDPLLADPAPALIRRVVVRRPSPRSGSRRAAPKRSRKRGKSSAGG